MTDRIELNDFTVDCVIGVLADEQRRTQPVQVSVAIGMDLEPASKGDLAAGVNYADVQAQVAFVLHYGQWRLLESAGYAIARLLLAPPSPCEARGQADEVRVSLAKPTILEGAVPRVVVERDALWCDLETRMVPPKLWVDVLVETERAGAYRVHLEADASWDVPPGAVLYLLGGDLRADGRGVRPGEVLARGSVGTIRNVGDESSTLLVIASPSLGE